VMSDIGSSSGKKAQDGESKPQATSGKEADNGTVLGFSRGGPKPIPGKPALVLMIKGKEVDTWNTIMTGFEAKELEGILSRAKTDNAYDMTQFIRMIEYQGFDRLFYIKHALTKMTISVFARFAIIGAIRGSNFQKITDSCEMMPQDLISAFTTNGFVKTPKKRTDITILRNTASIPHWCVYWSQKAGIAKKIPTEACPSELQFPGAASLPMSRSRRMQHLKFCAEFSQLLPGGQFNLNIYLTAMKNSIPISDIPNEVLTVLEVGATSENHLLKEDDMTPYSRAMVRTR
jgi:hypothetical protein